MKKKCKVLERILSLVLIASLFTNFTFNALAAEPESSYNGGWGITINSGPVYDSPSLTNRIGSLFAREGFTVLVELSNNVSYIEYSTASGTKRGYIGTDIKGFYDNAYAGVAKVNTTSNVYYGSSTSIYQKAGAVYAGENVVLLARNGDWSYIEYNTTADRKRGYIYSSSLTPYNTPLSGVYGDLYTLRTPKNRYIEGTRKVYSGPSVNYAQVGSVSDETVITRGYFWFSEDESPVYYIEYNVDGTNQKKSGFIMEL